MLSLVACGNKFIEKTTVYFSMIVSPSTNYIRLESDGDYYITTGQQSLKGKYEVDGDTLTLNEENGSTSYGYFINDNKYFLYESYNGYEDKIPDDDKFNIICFDGVRCSVTFKKDGKMAKDIYEENYINYHAEGTYKRNGNLITCVFVNTDDSITEQTYAVKDGVLYEAYSSNLSDFAGDKEIAKIANADYGDDTIDVIIVVVIVVLVIVIFGVIMFFLYGNKNKKNKRK